MDLPLIRLFEHDVAAIVAALPRQADPLWDVFAARRKSFHQHNSTRTIALKWCDLSSEDVRPVVLEAGYAPQALRAACHDFVKQLEDHFRGFAATVLLTELPPGGLIAAHRDSGSVLSRAHRCHLPIVTNPGVEFRVDDVPHYLEPGHAYEFDNLRVHSVSNNGSARRIHLICNVLPAAA